MLTFLAIALTPPKLEAVTFTSKPGVRYVLAREVAKAKGWKLTFDPLTRLSTLNGEPVRVDQPRLFNGELLLDAKTHWPSAIAGPKRVSVDLTSQTMAAFQGGIQVMRVKINSGDTAMATPVGEYVSGAKKVDKVSSLYDSKMPYAIHLRGNYYIHGSERTIRGPGSHGCIRVPLYNRAAQFLFDWIEPGTPVRVQGRRPDKGTT